MNPKRRFFQIHLSTAVVLMLVAGVLVWANVREHRYRIQYLGEIKVKSSDPPLFNLMYGWPFSCAGSIWRGECGQPTVKLWLEWFPDRVVYNSLIALAILLSVCVACEWRIRRRAARKANE